ncbi:MAG TPA: hypothetical protein VKQ36_12160, partial [Ktedonobacterales bacterium]|nr:hypothetical protein [Ktedonobacterales bacterium]
PGGVQGMFLARAAIADTLDTGDTAGCVRLEALLSLLAFQTGATEACLGQEDTTSPALALATKRAA